MASRSGELRPLLSSLTGSAEVDDVPSVRTRRRASWVLPLVVITYFLSYYTPVFILNPYIYDQVAKEYDFKVNTSSQHPCAENDNTTGNASVKKIQEEIEKRVSTIEMELGLITYLFAAISILLVGPLTDKYGRRLGLLFPIMGTVLKQVVYVIIVAKDYPPLFFFIGHIFDAAGGSFAAMLSCMFSVTADITKEGRQRSFRITIMEALQTLVAAAGGFAVGRWIKSSYLHPLLASLGIGILSLLLTILLMPETVSTGRLVAPPTMAHVKWGQRISHACCGSLSAFWRTLKKSFMLYVRDGQGRVVKRRLCITAFILTVAVNFSKPGVQNLYLMKVPLCWSATHLYTFGSIQLVCNWVAILCLLALMQRVFKMADRHVAIVGMISSMVSAIFMSLAVNNTMVYEVAVLSVMIRAIIPMLRSIMSSLVDSSQQGAVYASMGCVETIGACVFATIANRVFYATLTSWPGAVFIMFAVLMAIALSILLALNGLYVRDGERQRDSERATLQNNRVGHIQEEPDPSW